MRAVKPDLKGFIKLGVFLVFLISLLCIVFKLTYNYIIPASPEQVWDTLVSLGYEPYDSTATYIKQDSTLIRSVTIQKDDLRFDFFMFDNKGSAANVFSKALSNIQGKYRASPMVEGEWYSANNYKYSLKASGVYSIAMYVSSTAIYAYCDAENQEKVDAIFATIGY